MTAVALGRRGWLMEEYGGFFGRRDEALDEGRGKATTSTTEVIIKW